MAARISEAMAVQGDRGRPLQRTYEHVLGHSSR
jgi:hypothetical protein